MPLSRQLTLTRHECPLATPGTEPHYGYPKAKEIDIYSFNIYARLYYVMRAITLYITHFYVRGHASAALPL